MCIKVDKYSFLVYITNRAVVLTAIIYIKKPMQGTALSKNAFESELGLLIQEESLKRKDSKTEFKKFLSKKIEDSPTCKMFPMCTDQIDSFLQKSAKNHIDLYLKGKNQILKRLLSDREIWECYSYSNDLTLVKQLLKYNLVENIITLKIIHNLCCSENSSIVELGRQQMNNFMMFINNFEDGNWDDLVKEVENGIQKYGFFYWNRCEFAAIVSLYNCYRLVGQFANNQI